MFLFRSGSMVCKGDLSKVAQGSAKKALIERVWNCGNETKVTGKVVGTVGKKQRHGSISASTREEGKGRSESVAVIIGGLVQNRGRGPGGLRDML